MPEFPIVDAHLHLWNPDHFRLSWLDSNPLLNQKYDLARYNEATTGAKVEAMVYLQTEVETPYAFLEAAWVVEQAKADPRIQGIVPWAPLEYGERSRAFLAALVNLSPLVKGIRRIIQFEPDLAFCLQPDFVRGVQILPEYQLSFDICIDYRHLANTLKLVGQCPDTSFILDHIGKPNIKDGMLDPWRCQLEQLAAFPNVYCKVSGLVTEADHQTWQPGDLAPFVSHVLETFGEDRVIFGGDWPVVLQAAAWSGWVETLENLTVDLSAESKQKLWNTNAKHFYRLSEI
jgi:L-fuconolactonase